MEHLQAIKRLDNAVLAGKYNVHSFVPNLPTFEQEQCMEGNEDNEEDINDDENQHEKGDRGMVTTDEPIAQEEVVLTASGSAGSKVKKTARRKRDGSMQKLYRYCSRDPGQDSDQAKEYDSPILTYCIINYLTSM